MRLTLLSGRVESVSINITYVTKAGAKSFNWNFLSIYSHVRCIITNKHDFCKRYLINLFTIFLNLNCNEFNLKYLSVMASGQGCFVQVVWSFLSSSSIVPFRDWEWAGERLFRTLFAEHKHPTVTGCLPKCMEVVV